MAKASLQQPQPVHATLWPVLPTAAVVAAQQLMGRHLGIPHQDELIVAGDVGEDPAGEHTVFGQEHGVVIKAGIGAVVEVKNLQVLEVVGLVHRLEQGGAQLGVVVHGPARVHEQQHLHRVLPGALVAHLQHAAAVGGVLDGAVHIELRGRQIHQPGVLAELAQGHLKLAGIQGVVPAEVPEFPLPRHPKGPVVHGLSPHSDALGGQAGVAEGGHAVGAHPVAAAVVLLLLLLHPLLEHFFDVLLREQLVEPCLLLVPVGVVAQDVRPVQPVQQFLGHLPLKGDVPEVLEKAPVEAVKVRLALHQQAPAQVVKAGEAGPVQPLVQGLHQAHPLGEGDLQAAPAQGVEKVLKHWITPLLTRDRWETGAFAGLRYIAAPGAQCAPLRNV